MTKIDASLPTITQRNIAMQKTIEEIRKFNIFY